MNGNDDTDDFVEYLGCRKPNGVIVAAPPHMDAASWKLVQSLDENGTSSTRPLMEEHDYAYALQLRENWYYDQQMSEQPRRKTAETPMQVQNCLDPDTALKAYRYAESKAKSSHNQAIGQLKKRVKCLGFAMSALDECLAYIRDEAPIIIHLTEATLEKLVKDTHYRSLFETKTSGGQKSIAMRETWEHQMFGKCYDMCKPNLRPKYGCLNISGDIQGVRAAHCYGTFFLTLKNEVRYRTTFFDRDTGGCFKKKFRRSPTLATYQYYAHILQQYPDNELEAALHVNRLSGSRSKCQSYKEVQIHGDIRLDSDVQALSVPSKQHEASSGLKKLVECFQARTKCNILWQGDLVESVES